MCLQGEWSQGRRHGTGTIFLPNGDKFTGMFKDGRIAGPVEYAFAEDSPWASRACTACLSHTTPARGLTLLLLLFPVQRTCKSSHPLLGSCFPSVLCLL